MKCTAIGAAGFVLGLALALTLPSLADTTSPAPGTAARTVTVTGTGTVHAMPDEAVVSLGVQTHSISGLPYLPIGGSTTAFQGPEILAFGYLRPGDIHPRLIPIGSITIEDDSFFVLDGVNFEVTWAEILTRPVTDPYALSQLHTYGIQYFLVDRSLPGSFEAYGNTYPSPFAVSIESQRYLVYESGPVAIFFLQGRGG